MSELQNKLSSFVVDIDTDSGFCFGVVHAIDKAETHLKADKSLISLGKLVHNNAEVERLSHNGLKVVNTLDFQNLKNTKVLFRAHGEPPERYDEARKNNLEIIDGTCPVVLKLQKRIRNAYNDATTCNGQIIIYGKQGHAEVNGLVGQTKNEAIVIQSEADLQKIDKNKPTWLFAQTTQSIEGFYNIANLLKNLVEDEVIVHDTICRQVANRAPKLKAFVKLYDMVIFVSGVDSSNGKYLYGVCKEENPNSYFVSSVSDIDVETLRNYSRFGICGATSTPFWQMKAIADFVEKNIAL